MSEREFVMVVVPESELPPEQLYALERVREMIIDVVTEKIEQGRESEAA